MTVNLQMNSKDSLVLCHDELHLSNAYKSKLRLLILYNLPLFSHQNAYLVAF